MKLSLGGLAKCPGDGLTREDFIIGWDEIYTTSRIKSILKVDEVQEALFAATRDHLLVFDKGRLRRFRLPDVKEDFSLSTPNHKIIRCGLLHDGTIVFATCSEIFKVDCSLCIQKSLSSCLDDLIKASAACVQQFTLPRNHGDQKQSTITQISCGYNFIACLTEDGRVFCQGEGSRGQMGNGTLNNNEQFEQLALQGEDGEPAEIVQMSTGGWHTAALDKAGVIFQWGWNESHQVCPTKQPTTVCTPLSRDFRNFKKVCCGSRHTIALDETNEVWCWGWNTYGQCFQKDREYVEFPVMVKEAATDIQASLWTSAVKHTE